ncbi:MAG: urease accessory protein UreD [Roseomonas sp.]|nr:urease accessory protein UreD [Roseomonas sp.]
MLTDAPPAPSHQRSRGRAELGLVAAPGGARIAHLYQSSPLRMLFPDSDPAEPKQAALVNVAGGLAGGDSLEVAITLGPRARFTATTPAAEKIYRTLGPETEISSSLRLEAGSVCEWLPQETIVFDGARLTRRMGVDIAGDATLLAAEMLVLGRAARGERFTQGAVHDRWRIRRDGRLLWADAFRLADPGAAASPFVLDGAGAVATLLLAAPEAASHRDLLRDLTDGRAGVVAPGLLLARWMGEAGAVRAGVARALVALRQAALSLPPRLPRLWRT